MTNKRKRHNAGIHNLDHYILLLSATTVLYQFCHNFIKFCFKTDFSFFSPVFHDGNTV